jgi:hypothetical protein
MLASGEKDPRVELTCRSAAPGVPDKSETGTGEPLKSQSGKAGRTGSACGESLCVSYNCKTSKAESDGSAFFCAFQGVIIGIISSNKLRRLQVYAVIEDLFRLGALPASAGNKVLSETYI